jgi:hypothetical protein
MGTSSPTRKGLRGICSSEQSLDVRRDSVCPPNFNLNDHINWKKHLDDEGYVVINNIFNKATIDQAIELFWKDWCQVSPEFKRYDPTTWSIQTSPMMFAKGMAVFNGFGQSDFMWNLRLQPEIIDIFTKVHGTNDLITSFDGFSVFFSKKQKSPKDWWHIDQHPDNPIYTVQGAYNFLPVGENDAGLTIVPKSHINFKPSNTGIKKDWIQISKNKSANEAAKAVANGVKLIIPENCFVLWNSKTIHANTGMSGTGSLEDKLNRLTCYITYVPRSRTNNKIVEKRKKAYINGDTTSHWPEKVEVKTYPWGFGPGYEKKNFKNIIVKLEGNNDVIPSERLKYF